MLVRIYWTTWILFAVVAAFLFVTGTLNMLTIVAMGFVAFGLTFMGMMNVLPSMVAHPAPPAPVEPEPVAAPIQQPAPAKSFAALKSA